MKTLKVPETGKLVYRMIVDNTGRAWFFPANVDNPGDHILVTDSNDWEKCGEGFGGSTLKLITTDLEYPEFDLNGGWHVSSQSLKYSTGIDLTNKHLTYGCISELDGTVAFADEGWVVGGHHRIQEITQDMVEKSGIPLRYEVRSVGGGMSAILKPELDNYEKELQ